ncbi:nuclease-related domain-containing protein [Virgibacillus byunsanensis]|uniref:Nuclease-related domain-containing protein n=1 Tax=Virgibacillus byunsanensis TaxID=570945 RepID=A0ABW3LFT6_9BACI
MIMKKRNKPLPLVKLDAIIPRTSPKFPRLPDMKQDAAKRNKGYIGELQVDYHLDHLAKRYTILKDVYMRIHGKNVQMDTVVIAEHTIFIIDSKNYDGTITFDTILNQLTRNDGMKETGFEYPITQIENQQLQLQNWLLDHNLPNIPVHFFIAISDPSTIIKVIGDQQAVAKVVGHGARIPRMILNKDEEIAQTGSPKLQVSKIGKMILAECREFDIDIMGQYKVKKLLPGVQCMECGYLGMDWIYGKWVCKNCTKTSKHAHEKAIADYLLLVKPWITNKECMRFLNLKSRSVATRILQSSGLHYQKEHKRWIKRR